MRKLIAKVIKSSITGAVALVAMGSHQASVGSPNRGVLGLSDQENSLLLAVGAAKFGQDGGSVTVAGQTVKIDSGTLFSRGAPNGNGSYVAITARVNDKTLTATDVIRLNEDYVPGTSLVYLKGRVNSVTITGRVQINGVFVDVSSAFQSIGIDSLRVGDVVEVTGFEVISGTTSRVFASALNSLGSSGSGAKGITGSGAKGITGSGAKGITGSGAK